MSIAAKDEIQSELVAAPQAPSRWTRRDRVNTALCALGDGLWGSNTSLVASGTVLTIVLQKLGGGHGTLGLIGAIEGGAMVLPQAVGAYLLRSPRRRRINLVTWHLLGAVPFLTLIAVLLGSEARLRLAGVTPGAMRAAVLTCFACSSLAVGAIIPPWMDWFGHLFHTRIRGTVLGLCLSFSALAGIGSSLLAACLIERDASVAGFARHYGLAAVLATLSMVVFYAVRDHHLEPSADPDVAPTPVAGAAELVAGFKASLADTNFRAFLIGRTLATGGFTILPFITLHYTLAAGGALEGGFVVGCGAAQLLGMAVSQLAFGRLGDHCGHRMGMIVGAAVQVVALLIMIVSSGPVSCVLAFAAAGIAMGTGGIAHMNLLLETCPHDSRVAHITAGNLALAITSIAAPLASAAIAEAFGTRALFAVCLVISVAAAWWFVVKLKEPRKDGAGDK